jgi:hypothetical protein
MAKKRTPASIAGSCLALILAVSCDRARHPAETVTRQYQGTLDGKYAIRATLAFSGERAWGHYLLLPQDKPIPLEGVGNDASWQLSEFAAPGKATGHFSLKPGGPGILVGTRASPDGKDESEVWLHETGNSLKRHAALAGHWVSGDSSLDFLPLGGDRVMFQGPGGSLVLAGELSGIERIESNEIHYVAEGGEDSCRIFIRIKPEALEVKDNLRCAGMNASFTGVYRRTSPLTGDWKP